MGAWAWKAKNNDVKGHACRTSSGKSCCRSGYCVAGYVKDTIVGAYHRTSDGRKHKIIGRAGPEGDTIFHFMSQRAALATGKNTRLLGVLDQNETRFFTYVSLRAESKAATVMISLGSLTVARDFVRQLICLKSLESELEES